MQANPPPFEPDRRLFPFESHWFQSDVGQVHYIDEGSGPPILFLHGNPTWAFLYRGIVIRLRKSFRCIAMDYPGFGLSPHPRGYEYTPQEHASVVTNLVRGLGLDDLTIMGQEWGGPIGMRAALDDPGRVRALVMGNTWYWPMEAWHMKGLSAALSSSLGQKQILFKNALVERVLPLGVKHSLAPEVLDQYRGPFPTPQSRAGIAELTRQVVQGWSFFNDLSESVPQVLGDVPLLLTWGMADPAFGTSFMDRFRTDFTNVQVERLAARHFIQEDCPGEIARAIEGFLA
jgi:haloalkane dehalogenase